MSKGTIKISRETAMEEVISWMDAKGIDEDDRDDFKDAIEALSDWFVKGILRLDEKKNIIQKLRFPICELETGDLKFDEIKHRPRVWVSDIHKQYARLKAGSQDAKIFGCLCASVDQKEIFLKRLDVSDYRIASGIAGFLVV